MEKKHKVGIFSRSDQKDYEWLVKLLTSHECSDWVQEVRSTIISNSTIPFISEVTQCTFGILYHTKNRGAVNISDIDGSLYNEEMKILHDLLEKQNVLVVIDDLKDSSDAEKRRILKSQPSTESLACDLLLISSAEKKNAKTLSEKLKSLRPFRSTSENQSEILRSHDDCSNAKKCNNDSNYPESNYEPMGTETRSANKNPEKYFVNEISGRQNNTFETHENLYVFNSPQEEEEPIYDYPDEECLHTSEKRKNWDNATEGQPIPSSNGETCDGIGGHETMDLYEDPEAPDSPETFKTSHSVTAPKIPPCDESPKSMLFKEMLEKFVIRENSETKANIGNYETEPKTERPRSCSGSITPEKPCSKPKRYSNPPKPYKWFYNETEKTWQRNEDYETLSSGHKTKTTSKDAPQLRKWNHPTQTEAQPKNPERRSNSGNPPKWVYNEKEQTWQRN